MRESILSDGENNIYSQIARKRVVLRVSHPGREGLRTRGPLSKLFDRPHMERERGLRPGKENFL
jgi:hypothetical protein